MISGVASVSPFTTPEHACASGLSAGATNSFIRDYLTEHAIPVFTAPVMVGPGEVPAELPAAQGGDFGECPEQLPADLTVDSTNSVATAGKHLASFLGYLHEQYGVEQVDLIAHSLGGVFTRNAIRELQEQSSPVTVRTLTTLGSPWESSLMANTSDVPAEACGGFALCEVFMADLLAVPTIQQILDFLKPDSINAWNEQQVGVLDDIPVTLVAGTYFTKSAGTETKWPNDGFIQYDAATARNVPDSVLPQRACFSEPFTHSVYTSRYAGDTPSSAITWNDQSGLIVLNAIHSAGTPQQSINRLGCPTP
jgi:pimeloyl-ACP methyl ester carboxylesterase